MRETTSVKSFGVALAIILMLVLMGGCERKIIPGNPFDENYEEGWKNEENSVFDNNCYGSHFPVAQVTYKDDGRIYYVEAVQGQVIVFFSDQLSHDDAIHAIREAGGKVETQIPQIHYYLVNTCGIREMDFIEKVQANTDTEFVYPNAVSYPCTAKPYVLDNFNYIYPKYNASHGKMVSAAMDQCGASGYMNKYEVGEDGKKHMVWSEITHDLKEILDGASEENQPVINMSFGASLDKYGKKWTEVTDSIHDKYRSNYINEIKFILSILKPYNEKEFIIVKAAGNDGVWDFEREILTPLRENLNSDQRLLLDRHFLFVAAKDNNKTYSNDLKDGTCHKLLTKVDISDFEFNKMHVPGTSIAAPTAACYLTSAAKNHNLNVMEVLQYARMATEDAPNHILTPELLDKVIEMEKSKNPEVTIEGVLRMYLLNSFVGGSVTYYTDAEGNVINAVGEENTDNPYCQKIYEYRETDFDNTYLAFVVEVDNAINVTTYLEAGDDEFLDNSFQSAFMLVPQFQYNGKDFAEKYANKRVRATGTLYVPGGGWRNATAVVMSVRNIELLDNEEPIVSKRSHSSLVGTKWRSDFSHNPDIEWYDALQFDDETKGTALSVYEGESTVVTHFHYFYDEEYNGWCVTDWGKNIMYFVVSGNELNMGFYKPCIVNGKNCIFESRRYYKM